jgi:hypothetical protein
MSIVLMALYAGDMALSFFVAYYQDGQLVVDLKDIAGESVVSRANQSVVAWMHQSAQSVLV